MAPRPPARRSRVAITDGASPLTPRQPPPRGSPAFLGGSMVSAASPAPRRRWHKQFLALLPQIIILAKIAFRHLKPEARAEAVQEVVCQCLTEIRPPGRTQARPTSRMPPPWPPSESSKPVTTARSAGTSTCWTSPASIARTQGPGRRATRPPRQGRKGMVQEILVEDRHADAAAIVQTKLDFSDWLASLKRRDRRVAEFLAQGETTKAAARKFRARPAGFRSFAGACRQLACLIGDDPGPAAATAA